MPRTPLAPDHDIGVAILHADGSLTLRNGLKLSGQTLTNNRFPEGVFEVLNSDGYSARVNIRFDDGRSQSFAFIGTTWYELREDPSKRSPWQVVSRLRNVQWTRQRMVSCLVGGLVIIGFVIWSIAHAGRAGQSSAGQSSRLVDSTAKHDTTAGQPVKLLDSQPSARTTTQPSDDKTLNRSHLTFEQKRSQLYDLAEVVGVAIEDARNGANYRRTRQRLSGYRVHFSGKAEQALSQIADNVAEYTRMTGESSYLIRQRLDGVVRMESFIYARVKDGTIDPSIRRRYIDLSGIKYDTWIDNDLEPDPSEIRSRILRLEVSASDLFDLLVSIRNCQRRLAFAFRLDDQIAEFLALLPVDALALGGFRRELPASDHEAGTGDSSAYANRSSLEYMIDSTGPRKLLEELKHPSPPIKPMGVIYPSSTRDTTRTNMATDAGVLEESLSDYLLNYPWPWKVETIKPEGGLFELTSRPSQ